MPQEEALFRMYAAVCVNTGKVYVPHLRGVEPWALGRSLNPERSEQGAPRVVAQDRKAAVFFIFEGRRKTRRSGNQYL